MSDKPVAAGKSSFDLIDTEKAFALMAPMPGSKFLDLACGIGRYSMEIARKIGEKGHGLCRRFMVRGHRGFRTGN